MDDDYKTKPCQSGSALAHLLSIITKRVGELSSMLPTLTELLLEMTTTLKRHAAIPALTQPTFLFVSAVLQQINDGHAEVETLKASVADLLKVTSNLLTGKATQAIALEAVYDVIIQGDCLKGNWKPIISGLKVGMSGLICMSYILIDELIDFLVIIFCRRLQPVRIAVKVGKRNEAKRIRLMILFAVMNSIFRCTTHSGRFYQRNGSL